MATLTYVTGTSAASGYVRVGHNSSATNPDAVWSFVPTQTGASKITGVKFVLTWDNSTAGTGWSGTYNYVFAVSSSGASGTTAYNGSVLGRTTVSLSGGSGTATVTITGLSLTPGTTYYLRANFAGTTKSTMKAFKTTGGTATVANYTSLTYTISYNANGGSGTTPSSQTKTYGTALTLRSTSGLTRTGYTCIGWATSASATTATYPSGGSYTANAAATLYAVWKANTLTINYYGNGATGTGSSTSNTSKDKATITSTATYTSRSGKDLYYVATLFTKTGYTRESEAKAWRVGSATAATYWSEASQDIPASYFSAESNSVNLYANWKANTYSVTFNANGGTTPTKSKSVTYDSIYGALPTPTRTAYKFLGWYTEAEGGALVTASMKVGATADLTLYAHWEIAGTVRVYTGGAWHMAIPYIYTNGKFVQCIPKIYSGGSWKTGV